MSESDADDKRNAFKKRQSGCGCYGNVCNMLNLRA